MLTLLVRNFYRQCDPTIPDDSSVEYKVLTQSFPASILIVSNSQQMSPIVEEYGDRKSLGAQAESINSPTVVSGNDKPSKDMQLQRDPQTADEDSVDFDSPDDPSNPLNWSYAYKMLIVALISLMTTVEYECPRHLPLSLCRLCPFGFNVS